MNRAFIIGNLCNEPELRTTTSGKNVCSFTVAVNRRIRNNREEADFFRVSAWDALGENCKKFLTKGRKVAVMGSVSVRAYQTKNGDPAASLELTAQDVEFLSTPAERAENAVKNDAVKKDEQSGFEDVSTMLDNELPF